MIINSIINRVPVSLIGLLLLMATLILAIDARGQTQVGRVFLPMSSTSRQFDILPFGEGFNHVTAITNAGDGRLFVGELAGRIKILHPDGAITTFLDISDHVLANRGEYGMFDVAFHPQYPSNGFFYVSYTTGFDDGNNRDVHMIVSRFRVTADPNVADPASETTFFRESQAFDVHKGGGLDFDKRTNQLYMGVGDDRLLLIAQDNRSPKGKVIRFEVDKIPADFVGDGVPFLDDEVWSMGLRNPYRIDVDEATSQIYIGEVGDSRWEEINLASTLAPFFNYGWPCIEGPQRIPEASDIPECKQTFVPAIDQYPHDAGDGRCAVIGGKVYRPRHNPDDGRYIYTDLCSKEIFSLSATTGIWERTILGVSTESSLLDVIGEDAQGYLWAGSVNSNSPIYRLYIP